MILYNTTLTYGMRSNITGFHAIHIIAISYIVCAHSPICTKFSAFDLVEGTNSPPEGVINLKNRVLLYR